MDIKELNGDYEVSVVGDGTGVYSQKTVSVQHSIQDGVLIGSDEYGVVHSGTLSMVDDEHVAFSITIDPGENNEVITTLESGLLTDGAQTIEGVYKISRKAGEILLTTVEDHGGVNAMITCKKDLRHKPRRS